jgi:cysteine desulfuration protein SufE
MFTPDDLSSVSLQELIATNNWQSQYRLITQWGKLIQHKPELRNADNLVKGCEVSAWLAHKEEEGGLHHFAFDSDSRVINGLAVLSVGLEKYLTPSRNNGLRAIIARVNSSANKGS